MRTSTSTPMATATLRIPLAIVPTRKPRRRGTTIAARKVIDVSGGRRVTICCIFGLDILRMSSPHLEGYWSHWSKLPLSRGGGQSSTPCSPAWERHEAGGGKVVAAVRYY